MAQAVVVSTKRTTNDDGKPIVEIRIDTGGNVVTADHFDGAGEDALPLPGDIVEYGPGAVAGSIEVIGYHDTNNAGQAAEGERRTYARSPDGSVAAEIWAKGNGDITIRSIKAGGKLNLNGVTIDQQGNITTAGEVMAMSAGPGTGVKLSSHLHPTGTGPSGPPTPGT